MFAVVNVIPKRGNDVDGVRITGGNGSFGTRRGAVTYGRSLPSGLDVTVTGSLLRRGGESLYYAEFDDEESNNGLAQDVDGDESYSGYASLAWKGLSVAGFIVSRTKDV